MKQINKYNVYNRLFLIYRRLFRKAFLIVVLACCTSFSMAQKQTLDGSWNGKLLLANDNIQTAIEFEFNNNVVVNLNDDINKKNWYNKAKTNVKQDDRSITFTWIENTEFGVHSEIYKISMINSDSAIVNWTRHCVIYGLHRNEAFEQTGSGFLQKSAGSKIDGLVKQ
jgi:hypothetical protein